jgi:hypothetical protein
MKSGMVSWVACISLERKTRAYRYLVGKPVGEATKMTEKKVGGQL